ncbi:MAG: WGR domain-containing protein [Pseudomonadota bacterium]
MNYKFERIQPTKNMYRFYELQVDQDLLGDWVLVRRWGRIGSFGRVAREAYQSRDNAIGAALTLKSAKEKRGYSVTDKF